MNWGEFDRGGDPGKGFWRNGIYNRLDGAIGGVMGYDW